MRELLQAIGHFGLVLFGYSLLHLLVHLLAAIAASLEINLLGSRFKQRCDRGRVNGNAVAQSE